MGAVILRYQYTPADLVEANRLHLASRPFVRYAEWLIAGFCMVPVLLYLVLGPPAAWALGAVPLLLLLLLARRWSAARQARRRLAARPELLHPLQLELAEQPPASGGPRWMKVQAADGADEGEWTPFVSWREGPRHILLYADEKVYHAVPMRAIEDMEAFRRLLDG